MSAELEQAAQAVEDTRTELWARPTRRALAAFEQAVRRHDAELVRAYRDSMPLDGNARTAMTLAAACIEPKEHQ